MVSKVKIVKVCQILYISTDRAKELVGHAKKSVILAMDKVTGKLIMATVKQIFHIKQVIKTERKVMAQECFVLEVNLLKSFIGIRDILAIGLMFEMQNAE